MGRAWVEEEPGRMIGRALLRPSRLGYLALVPTIAAAGVLALSTATTELPVLPRNIAIGLLFASVIAQFAVTRRDLRHLSVAFAIGAVTLSGATRAGVPYMIA